jgi:hypothetical protein
MSLELDNKESGSNWDWKSSLDDTEVLSIAEMSYKISTYLQKPLIIMFFINYPNSKIHAHILPWQLIHEIPEFSDTIPKECLIGIRLLFQTARTLNY